MRERVRAMIVGLLAAGLTVSSAPTPAPAPALALANTNANANKDGKDSLAWADAITPDDPAYSGQWGLVKSRVNQAWSATRGNGRVVIAVVDSGVNPVSDLAGRVLPGHDFVNGDDDASDDNGHGTMAAGVIAAAGYNRKAVAGVCWSCKILPVKVLGAKGSGTYTDIAAGIRWAADQHATIISLSLGGSEDSPVLRDAVAYADEQGSLVVAAAGNQGSSAPHYPAAIPSVLAVGGVDAADHRYSWSDFGSWVDVTAPGCNLSQARDGSVGQYCGTSSATPFVAGVAGLLASTDPAPTAAEIRSALISSAAQPADRVDAVNALTALPYAGDTTDPAVTFGAIPALVRGRVTVTAAAADQHGVAGVRLYAGGRLVGVDTTAPYTFSWQSAPSSAAVPLELRAYDRAGNVTAVRRYVRPTTPRRPSPPPSPPATSPPGRPTRPASPGCSCSSTVVSPRSTPVTCGSSRFRPGRARCRSGRTTGRATQNLSQPAGKLAA